LRVVRAGLAEAVACEPQMAVQIDERRNDRLAARVNYTCILRVADRPRRSDSAYDAAFNHEGRVLDRRPTRAVNQARAFEDHRADWRNVELLRDFPSQAVIDLQMPGHRSLLAISGV